MSGAELSFAQTVPRELVHRRALGEVFIADSAQIGDDEFLLAIQIPRAHSLWFDRHVSYHDPLATLEASRQGTFVIVHRHLAVPSGPRFSLHRIDFRVEDLEAFRDDELSPLEGISHARLVSRQTHGELLVGLSLEASLSIDGCAAATLNGEIAFLPEKDYEVLRAVRRARLEAAPNGALAHQRRVDPALVGRRDPRNVVIGEPAVGPSEGETRYPLVVDERHPSFYDHPQDHVPGPLIIEAYRQAAILTAHGARALPSPLAVLTGCQATFKDFCESEAPAECSAAVVGAADGRVSVAVGLHQFDREISEAVVELAEQP